MASRSRALVWTGVGLCVAGAVGLVVGGLLDVDAADPWASVAGGTAGLLGLALTVYALFAPAPTAAVTASGTRSVAAGGGIGSAVTGDGASLAPPATMPTSTPPPASGPVTASGERSVAAGGDIGAVSTGDA
ncbi:hypothetical protein [Streptomyces lincolnensis]|uniref:hypothetical protein n=1 Tax=Streptomyces lincolnensis TaxID=1915 RepID=UPI00082E5ED1|nr:hypothetical protein [Streptomyces lincolnensis]QMV07783.1 hypothetical protein GJU35_20330 [Streptomyces lincolnensis]